MNDMMERWHFPWHELQRRLATDRVEEPAVDARLAPRTAQTRVAYASSGASWLIRARRMAAAPSQPKARPTNSPPG